MAKRSGQRRIKLSANLKPFVSRVVRDGAVQRAFAEKIGRPVGSCVSRQTKGKKGVYSGADIHQIVKDCIDSNRVKNSSLGVRGGKSSGYTSFTLPPRE